MKWHMPSIHEKGRKKKRSLLGMETGNYALLSTSQKPSWHN